MRLQFFCFLFAAMLAFPRAEEGPIRGSPFKGESTDLLFSAAGVAVGALFNAWQVNENHPAIESDVKSYVKESVPASSVAVVQAAYSVVPYFVDKEDAQRHFRGFTFAFCANFGLQSMTASIIGRHRPNYDSARAAGLKPEARSFYSGHTSGSFISATYLSLYLQDHVRNPSRYIVPPLLYAYASYVGWTRYNEHWHHGTDVLAGGIYGTAIAWFSYQYFQKNRRVRLVADASTVSAVFSF
jgi:membrane-associated phospholipid phosphatase